MNTLLRNNTILYTSASSSNWFDFYVVSYDIATNGPIGFCNQSVLMRDNLFTTIQICANSFSPSIIREKLSLFPTFINNGFCLLIIVNNINFHVEIQVKQDSFSLQLSFFSAKIVAR